MAERLVPIFFWLMMLFPVGLFAWQQFRFKKHGTRIGRRIWKFLLWSILPPLAYGVVFFAMVAIERITRVAMISDGYARSVLLVVGIGMLWGIAVTVLFGMVCLWRGKRSSAIG